MPLDLTNILIENDLWKQIYLNHSGNIPAWQENKAISTNEILRALYIHLLNGDAPLLNLSIAVHNNDLLRAIYILMSGSDILDNTKAYKNNCLIRKIFTLLNNGTSTLNLNGAVSNYELLMEMVRQESIIINIPEPPTPVE